MTNHFYGHQKAIILNNIVIATLSFSDHIDNSDIVFDSSYDIVVDLCEVDKDAFIGDIWDGSSFKSRPYPSWVIGDSLDWKAPTDKPGIGYVWNEETLSWVLGNDSEEVI